MAGEVWELGVRRYPLLQSLVSRYEAYRAGKELLTVVGYLCLSALEDAHSQSGRQRRKQLGEALAIDCRILQKLGALVSTVGTLLTARKIDPVGHDTRDLTPGEEYWIQRVLHELIRRAGEVARG